MKKEQGIEMGYHTLRRWCQGAGLVKRRKGRRRKARHARVRMQAEGMLLQLDGTPHRFNGKEEWTLIAAIDDATSEIPYAEFFPSEDTLSCMKVLRAITEKKGIPVALYVDRAGIFGGQKRQDFSQFSRACDELGIRVIFADSPEAKGRIERAWDTIQDRITPELRLAGIIDRELANQYLQTEFLPNYWAKNNQVIPLSLESRYSQPRPGLKLDEIFCLREQRAVKRNHTISWNGVLYRVNSDLRHSIEGQKIEIRTYPDQSWKAYFAGNPISLLPLPASLQANPRLALKLAS